MLQQSVDIAVQIARKDSINQENFTLCLMSREFDKLKCRDNRFICFRASRAEFISKRGHIIIEEIIFPKVQSK